MTKIKILIILCISSVFFYEASAQAYTPFNFIRESMSARSAALAGCMVSMKDDPTAHYFNPASISTVEKNRFAATFLKHAADINSGNVSYIGPVSESDKNTAYWAASVAYTNYGSFDYADINGDKSGQTFGANNMAFAGTYSNMLDSNLYYGVTAKFIYSNLEEVNSTAFAIDAGIFYKLKDGRSNFGLSVLHAGTQLSKFSNESEDLPLDIRIGMNHRLKGLPLLVNASFHHLADETDQFTDKLKNFAIAGELYLGKVIMVRLGYDNQVRQFSTPDFEKGLSGISAGVGIKGDNFTFDYGFARYGSAATLHRFSLAFDIN